MTTRTAPYTRFYKTMLILSTIGTAIGILNLTSLPGIVAQFSQAPVFNSALLAMQVITLVSVVALVLLWRKQIEGFYLKIGSYIANIVTTIVLILTAQPYIQQVLNSDEFKRTDLSANQLEFAAMLTQYVIYGAFAASILMSLVFMLLWIAAWKRQQKEDS